MPDIRLVKKGRDEPLDGLLQQARASHEIAKAAAHVTPLSENGWTAEDTTALGGLITALDSKAAAKADAYELSLGLTDAEQAAIDQIKKFIRKLRNALPRALRETPVPGVTAESFHAGETLGRSTPKISAYLAKIRPSVARLDAGLARFFAGAPASTTLDTLKTALDNADSVQEAALTALPAETQAIYENKGRLLEMIEDLNRAGKSAYDGDAAKQAQFNKDILLRSRRARRTATPTPAPAPAT